MKVKEKLEIFSKITLNEAEHRREQMQEELNREYKKACDVIAAKAKREAGELINQTKYKTEQLKNREILKATDEAKKSLVDLRTQLTDDLFERVKARLLLYTQSTEYIAELFGSIERLSRKYQSKIFVKLNQNDYTKSFAYSFPNVEYALAKDDIFGGFVADIPELHLLIDESMKSSLIEARNSFIGFKIT